MIALFLQDITNCDIKWFGKNEHKFIKMNEVNLLQIIPMGNKRSKTNDNQ